MSNPLAVRPLKERLSEAELNDPYFLRGCMEAGEKLIKEHRAKLIDEERTLVEVKSRLHFLYHGVEPGVKVRKPLTGEIYTVHRVCGFQNPDPSRKPSLEGFKQKKDGTFGVRACAIWGNWELVK